MRRRCFRSYLCCVKCIETAAHVLTVPTTSGSSRAPPVHCIAMRYQRDIVRCMHALCEVGKAAGLNSHLIGLFHRVLQLLAALVRKLWSHHTDARTHIYNMYDTYISHALKCIVGSAGSGGSRYSFSGRITSLAQHFSCCALGDVGHVCTQCKSEVTNSAPIRCRYRSRCAPRMWWRQMRRDWTAVLATAWLARLCR